MQRFVLHVLRCTPSLRSLLRAYMRKEVIRLLIVNSLTRNNTTVSDTDQQATPPTGTGTHKMHAYNRQMSPNSICMQYYDQNENPARYRQSNGMHTSTVDYIHYRPQCVRTWFPQHGLSFKLSNITQATYAGSVIRPPKSGSHVDEKTRSFFYCHELHP